MQKLGGQPDDNQQRVYLGSADDLALNTGVQRCRADPAALVEIGRHAWVASRSSLYPGLAYAEELLYTCALKKCSGPIQGPDADLF